MSHIHHICKIDIFNLILQLLLNNLLLIYKSNLSHFDIILNLNNNYISYHMLHNKYKYIKNYGLLPKLPPKQTTNITTFALINPKKHTQYTLQTIKEENKQQFCLFNDKQYIHRKCTHILQKSNISQIINKLDRIYPKYQQTLTIFFVNDHNYSDKLILGHQDEESIISKIYNEMMRTKGLKNKIRLSIIGIQNQNYLTDQLNYEWCNKIQENNIRPPSQQQMSIQKSKIKITKDENNNYKAQNILKEQIYSQQHLFKILKKYRQMRINYQQYINNLYSLQYYQLGQLYQLSQYSTIQSSSSQSTSSIISTHYILKINQYIRTTSSLMLKLSITLQKMMNYGKSPEVPDSKLFKLLSQCFVPKNQKFHIHLFLQVGQYKEFKEEYLCLVTNSQFLTFNNHYNDDIPIEDRPFFFTKQYSQYPILIQKIKKIKNKSANQYFISQIQQSFLNNYKRIYNKSYFNPTLSSIEKKTKRISTLSSQVINNNGNDDADQLVHETIKMYTQLTPALTSIKEEYGQLNNSKLQKRNNLRPNILQKKGNKSIKQRESLFIKQKSPNISINFSQNTKQKIRLSIHKNKNNFYQATKLWLDSVYGRNLHKNLQKLKKKDINDVNLYQGNS